MMKTNSLSKFLWTMDPLRTMCNGVDYLDDEYDVIAREVAGRVESGEDFNDALLYVLNMGDSDFTEFTTTQKEQINAFIQTIQ